MDAATVWWILVGVGWFALGGYNGVTSWEAGEKFHACLYFYIGCTFVLFMYGVMMTVGLSLWIIPLFIIYALPIGLFERIFPINPEN